MNKCLTYGNAPYACALLHGGPGACGELTPLAKELSCRFAVLEPWQNRDSIVGQLLELREILDAAQQPFAPLTLVGHSWGAWLALIFAADHPKHVAKLILVCPGPFQEKYVSRIRSTRLARMDEYGRAQMEDFTAAFKTREKDPARFAAEFETAGRLLSQTDSLDPDPAFEGRPELKPEQFCGVWPEAVELRQSGRLAEYLRQVRCPVTAICGDFDPHPAAGVKGPLRQYRPDARFILLRHCGHKPWAEKRAREEFLSILKEEIPVPADNQPR